MNKPLAIAAVLLAAVFVVAFATYFLLVPRTSSQTEVPKKDTVTVEGVIGCLEPKDKAAVQDLSCAIGLKADDGKSYALGANDPSSISMPTGQRVVVSGSLTEQESKYDSEGVIVVATVKQL